MKKSIVAGLVILAIVVLVSPGIVGRLAEKSVDQQLEWAADESQQVVITASKFDRSWFSSAGQHRIEIADTLGGQALRARLGIAPHGPAPAIVIDTELDHGLIPVTSMQRDEGSLMPGLGSAESRIRIEMADGSVVELPGVVRTRVGLTGGINSRYKLEPGQADDATWGNGRIELDTSGDQRHVVFEALLDSMAWTDGMQEMSIADFAASGDMKKTRYGFSVGDIALSIGKMRNEAMGQAQVFGPFSLQGESRLKGEQVDSDFSIGFAMEQLPGLGDVSWQVDGKLNAVDAEAAGLLSRRLKDAQNKQDPQQLLAMANAELQAVMAHGLDLLIDRFEVSVPEGKIDTELEIRVSESDPASFTWAHLLLGTEARADIRLPVTVFDQLALRDPNMQSAVAMGFLQRDGDNYHMQAEYKKGLLTVNGAPMPIPLPAM